MGSLAFNEKNKREIWKIVNISNKIVTLGDLPKTPSLKPNAHINLLDFATRDQISQSKSLKYLLNKHFLVIKKEQDLISTTSYSVDSVTDVEKDETFSINSNINNLTENLIDTRYSINHKGNSLIVTTEDNLNDAYDWIKSNDRNLTMGVLSYYNRRTLILTNGVHNLSKRLILDTNFVDICSMTPENPNATIVYREESCFKQVCSDIRMNGFSLVFNRATPIIDESEGLSYNFTQTSNSYSPTAMTIHNTILGRNAISENCINTSNPIHKNGIYLYPGSVIIIEGTELFNTGLLTKSCQEFGHPDEIFLYTISDDGVTGECSSGWYKILEIKFSGENTYIYTDKRCGDCSNVGYKITPMQSIYENMIFCNLNTQGVFGISQGSSSDVYFIDATGGNFKNCVGSGQFLYGSRGHFTQLPLSGKTCVYDEETNTCTIDFSSELLSAGLTHHNLIVGDRLSFSFTPTTPLTKDNYQNTFQRLTKISSTSITFIPEVGNFEDPENKISTSFDFTTTKVNSQSGECHINAYNCSAGYRSFGGDGVRNISGIFKDCSGGDGSFGGCNIVGSPISGTMIRCNGGDSSFALRQEISGTLIDCNGGSNCFAACFSEMQFSGNAATTPGNPYITGFLKNCVSKPNATYTKYNYSFGQYRTGGSDASPSGLYNKRLGTMINCVIGDITNANHYITDQYTTNLT